MYKIKDKFNLLVNVDNITDLSSSQIKSMMIMDGIDKLYTSIRTNLIKSTHFTSYIITDIVNKKLNMNMRQFVPILYDKYKMAAVYNKKTDEILLNISYYNVDDIYGNKPDPRVLMANIMYGYVLSQISKKNINIHEDFAGPIIAFLNTVVLSIFGKQYGLIGAYVDRIPLLKYLTACYVLASFFNVTGSTLFEKAKQYSNVSFRDEIDQLRRYDFSNILDYIKAISESKAMPGFSVHEFTHKIYRFLGIHFLAAFEDFSRFMAIMTISEMPGNSFVPFSLKKYNQREYQNIIKTCKKLFHG